ncbi:MAG: hypothetical protein QG596_1875 [Actinomycetota bacterium]|nr:hypothetical protein [Actinomycetota bacterium]
MLAGWFLRLQDGMMGGMGRLLAGMLTIVIGVAAFGSVANAAEIPPTSECTNLFKRLLKESVAAGSGGNQPQEDQRLLDELFEAGCISDSEPLLKPVELKPFSDACVDAAADFDRYWTAFGPTMGRLAKPMIRKTRPIRERRNRVIKRIRKLRERGAVAKRVAPLVRLRKALVRRERRVARPYLREFNQTMRVYGYNAFLTLFELDSLRCMDFQESSDGKPRGPAEKVATKHAISMFGPMLLVLFELDPESDSSSRGASASSLSASASPGIPLVGAALAYQQP